MSKLKDGIIRLLGGHTSDDWSKLCLHEDAKHEDALAEKDRVILELTMLSEGTPEGCKRGTWCAECGFAQRKTVRVGTYPYYDNYTTYYCGKAEACQHLLRKGG